MMSGDTSHQSYPRWTHDDADGEGRHGGRHVGRHFGLPSQEDPWWSACPVTLRQHFKGSAPDAPHQAQHQGNHRPHHHDVSGTTSTAVTLMSPLMDARGYRHGGLPVLGYSKGYIMGAFK